MRFSQHILAVEAQPIIEELDLKQGFNVVDYDAFLEAAKLYQVFGHRELLDEVPNTAESIIAQLRHIEAVNPNIKLDITVSEPFKYKGDRNKLQLLPYLVFRFGNDGIPQYAMYQRGKGVGEARLLGNTSCGYGGHIDIADNVVATDLAFATDDEDRLNVDEDLYSTLSLEHTIKRSTEREIDQEVFISHDLDRLGAADLEPVFEGLILDRGNDVGYLHLGLVFSVDVPEEYTVTPNEPQLLVQPRATAEEILASGVTENWTKIVAEHFAQLDADDRQA